MTEKKDTIDSNWVDTDDAPELTREWFAKADLYHGDTLLRRGRPPKAPAQKKISLHLRVDPEVAAAFRATGKGWQTRINALLKAALPLNG